MKDEVEELLDNLYNDILGGIKQLSQTDASMALDYNGDAMGKALEEATQSLLTLFHKAQIEAVRAARIDELNRTIDYFYDENRESKTVLRAFKAQRIFELTKEDGVANTRDRLAPVSTPLPKEDGETK